MTAQMAEQFINNHPRVDVSWLKLYFVSAELPVEPAPPESALRSTALWRGYIGTWRLNADGSLELLRFTFPHFIDEGSTTQEFAPKAAKGDFRLTFRPFFHGPNTEIPFVEGRVVEDKCQWNIEDEVLAAEAYEAQQESGLCVRIWGGVGFVPRDLLLEPASKLEEMVGRRLHCKVVGFDDRGTLILREVEVHEGE